MRCSPFRRCSVRDRHHRRAYSPWRCERNRALPVANREETCFLSDQLLLDYHRRPGQAKRARETGGDCLLHGGQSLADTTALPLPTVRLDDERSAVCAGIGERFCRVREMTVPCRRNGVLGADRFRERLRSFQLSRRRRRAEDRQPAFRKSSARPSTSGASGPMTASPIPASRQNAITFE